MDNSQNLIETDLVVDGEANVHLKETAVWGRFLSIVGLVYSVLIAIGALFAASMLAKLSGNTGSNPIVTGGAVAFIYLLIAGAIFFMSMYLLRFSKKALAALQTNDTERLTASFKDLKIYFRFAGIITVIGLIFTVLGVIGILMATAFTG